MWSVLIGKITAFLSLNYLSLRRTLWFTVSISAVRSSSAVRDFWNGFSWLSLSFVGLFVQLNTIKVDRFFLKPCWWSANCMFMWSLGRRILTTSWLFGNISAMGLNLLVFFRSLPGFYNHAHNIVPRNCICLIILVLVRRKNRTDWCFKSSKNWFWSDCYKFFSFLLMIPSPESSLTN